jgi:hypothetical protein
MTTWIVYPIPVDGETTYQTFSRWLDVQYVESDPDPNYGTPYVHSWGRSHGRMWIRVEF